MRTPLPADPPFPTAGELTRKNGRYAVCTFVGGAGVGAITLTAFDWEVEITTEFVDGTGHGDIWDVPVPLKYQWTGRARGYFDTSSNPYMHAYNLQTGATPPDILTGTFTAYQDDVPTTVVFAAPCFVVRARWNVPHAMLEQELELRGTGVPTTIL